MKYSGIFIFSATLFGSQLCGAVTISQCVQPDGTIEFTNQGCSGSSRLSAKRVFSNDLTYSYIKSSYNKNTRTSSSKRKQKPFRQKEFIQLQSRLLKAQSLSEIEEHTRTIMYKVNDHARKGHLRAAYNMIAATYARLAKEHKQKKWQGKPVSEQALKVQALFENILITQSTTRRPSELTQIIQNAWDQFQSNI